MFFVFFLNNSESQLPCKRLGVEGNDEAVEAVAQPAPDPPALTGVCNRIEGGRKKSRSNSLHRLKEKN